MDILIVFDSESGNTKKVVEILREKLEADKYNVKVKHALTAQTQDVEETDLLLIGTPVHGYMLFGQKPTKTVRTFLSTELPKNLKRKPVLGFATYLLFPASALKPIQKSINTQNGEIIELIAKRRNKKQELANEIFSCIRDRFPL
jgi:menaquinone-dependent protoporphyrinogen IX oxidase